jgi:hypothetical protein
MCRPWWFLHRSNQPFQHPDTTKVPAEKTIYSEKIVPTLGDFINHYGLTFYWTKEHRTSAELEPLRYVGDVLADDALSAMKLGPSDDPLTHLTPIAKKLPPVFKLYEQVTTVPSWVDWERVNRGQQVFVRYAGGSGMALLHCSLVGGFGAPKINKVLGATGYLSRSCQASYVRLFETLQMIVDCTEEGGLEPLTGIGWKACIRVRMLHAKVRRRLMKMDKFNTKEWGVPINQEDMCATLLSFQIIVLECLDFMNFHLTIQEQRDYTHLWRLIGYYSGVEEENNPCLSYSFSRATLESITRHIVLPDETSCKMSNHVLKSVSNRPPLHLSYECGSQLSRMLLGDVGADNLMLPKEHFYWHLFHGLHFVLLRFLAYVTWLPFIGDGMMRTQRMVLRSAAKKFQGGKRTKYFLKHIPDDKHFDDIGIDDSGSSINSGDGMRGLSSNIFHILCCGNSKIMKMTKFVLLVALFWKVWIYMLS